MKWLVTGSSGYIAQHVIEQFLLDGLEVIGIDSKILSDSSPIKNKFKHYVGDICDEVFISRVFKDESIKGVVNLAALKSVDESLAKPELYEQVNFRGVQKLLAESIKSGVQYFIQSSTAAVYGSSQDGFVDEMNETLPISPYGATKLKAENLLSVEISRGAIRGTSLRYFNVIGSSKPEMQDTSKANIVPMVLGALQKGQNPRIFGADYETPDGTCVRDYVHVVDIARAHLLAAEKVQMHDLPPAINIGTGKGYSVREIMNEILAQKGSLLIPEVHPRRQGDPALLVARVELAQEVLSFRAERGLSEMIASAI
jgi:UDP-glucose 4-epimerase